MALDVLEAGPLDPDGLVVVTPGGLVVVTPDGLVVVARGLPSAELPSSALDSGLSTANSEDPGATGLAL